MSQRQRAVTKTTGWRRERAAVPLWRRYSAPSRRGPTGSFWRKLVTFLGPGYLVAVGYMDPGNWATSLAGGSKFGYALLTVALLSNLMAILLQALCARLGIGAGRDLAQACRDAFPRALSWPLWVLAEIAICATDLAEVIGTAIGLNLLFHIPLEIGVLITALDVFLVLVDAKPRLPLDRGIHCHADGCDRRSASSSRSRWQIRTGRPSSRASRQRPRS